MISNRKQDEMARRYVSIWFRHLTTDWFSLTNPELRKCPFVLRTSSKGRMIVTAANSIAESNGIGRGMPLADARAILPELKVLDDIPDLAQRLLRRLAEWCIRFTPTVAVDFPEGLLLDVTGCSHLWGGDENYVNDIRKKLSLRGYDVRIAIADTAGAAWAMSRFGKGTLIVEQGRHPEALLTLPPDSLRLEPENTERLHKLGLRRIQQFVSLPRHSLRRRFGNHFLQQLDKALGREEELIDPVLPVEPYQERLPCMEPIVTATGIETALEQLLQMLCQRLMQEQKGLRIACLKSFRVDGKIQELKIETHRATHSVKHIFKLFEDKIKTIEPDLGIELFVLEAPKVEDHLPFQEKMWEGSGGLDDVRLSELIDRLSGRIGMSSIHRYVPAEHYWPERSFKTASSLDEKLSGIWPSNRIRPLQFFTRPERIEVTAPIPDYPPMLFIYRGKIHHVKKADGPERIEQEWWIHQGEHRDYYRVEDEEGIRYWVFRVGHYNAEKNTWFVHGVF